MFILYFYGTHHEYYHGTFYRSWSDDAVPFRPGEGHWLVPGTDPEDCFYD
jgi:hypothetical protein